jgi:hypothetical protein
MMKAIIILSLIIPAFALASGPKESDIQEVSEFVQLFVDKPAPHCAEGFPAEVRTNLDPEYATQNSVYKIWYAGIYVRCQDRVEWKKTEDCIFIYCDQASNLCEDTGRWKLEACDVL